MKSEYKKEIKCPIELVLAIVGDKWKIMIVRELFVSVRRFNELLKSLAPISQKMLTQQLRALEEDDIVSRTVYNQIPPKVEYYLTERGRTLAPVLKALGEWGYDNYKNYMDKYDINIDRDGVIAFFIHLERVKNSLIGVPKELLEKP